MTDGESHEHEAEYRGELVLGIDKEIDIRDHAGDQERVLPAKSQAGQGRHGQDPQPSRLRRVGHGHSFRDCQRDEGAGQDHVQQRRTARPARAHEQDGHQRAYGGRAGAHAATVRQPIPTQ
jgi:hypothetical protein